MKTVPFVVLVVVSRLSVPATEPPGSRRVSEGVPEGLLNGSRGVLVPVSRRTLQNPFKTPSRTHRKPFQEGVEIDDALSFPELNNQFQGPGSCSRK